MPIKGELVQTTTPDGLTLHGMAFEPVDGGGLWVVHVHGSCGNFYQEPFINPLAEALTAAGVGMLTVNTRGHDAEAYVVGRSAGPQRESWQIGTRRDIFGQCVHDLTAWTDLARSHGATRVVLSGHSAGAVKVAHYAAQTDEANLAGLILLSPGDILSRSVRGPEDAPLQDQLADARKLAAENPGAMRPGRFLSAAAFLSVFDHPEDAGVFAFSDPEVMARSSWPKLSLPSLVVFGANDAGYLTPIPRNVELLETLRRPGAPLTVEILKATDHYFAGKEPHLAKRLAAWVRELG